MMTRTNSGIALAKVLVVVLAAAVVGYFVFTEHHNANMQTSSAKQTPKTTQSPGKVPPAPAKAPTAQAPKQAKALPEKSKTPRPDAGMKQTTVIPGKANATKSGTVIVMPKNIAKDLKIRKAFMHSSKSGVFLPPRLLKPSDLLAERKKGKKESKKDKQREDAKNAAPK